MTRALEQTRASLRYAYHIKGHYPKEFRFYANGLPFRCVANRRLTSGMYYALYYELYYAGPFADGKIVDTLIVDVCDSMTFDCGSNQYIPHASDRFKGNQFNIEKWFVIQEAHAVFVDIMTDPFHLCWVDIIV